MSRKKRTRRRSADAKADDGSADVSRQASSDAGGERVSVGEWQDRRKPTWRQFPGPRGVDVPLRVALERAAYAEVVAHAKESLDAEICGVLVGTNCIDDDGPFVHAEAAIRGATFESARPESSDEFQTRAGRQQRVPNTRKGVVWLFVFGVLPCTAPLTAVIGGTWYMLHRADIKKLPAVSVGMAVIGLAAALGQTILIALLTILYAQTRG